VAVTVATLRLRSAAADTTALRLRVARALQAADLAPAALSPQAVLVVRQLVEPLPGRFGGGGGRPAPEWEHSVRDRLAGAARTAARPDRGGSVAPGAQAVLFADEAELAACLIADRVRGVVAERWWWRGVLGGADAADWLRDRVLSRGEVLAPTLALLAERAQVAAWLAQMTEDEAEQAAATVARAFALPPPGPAPDVSDAWADASNRRDESVPAAMEDAGREASAARARLAAVVPELRRCAGLGPARRRLLAVALAVMRDPAWARTSALPAALQVLERGGADDPTRASHPPVPANAVFAGTEAASAAPPPSRRRGRDDRLRDRMREVESAPARRTGGRTSMAGARGGEAGVRGREGARIDRDPAAVHAGGSVAPELVDTERETPGASPILPDGLDDRAGRDEALLDDGWAGEDPGEAGEMADLLAPDEPPRVETEFGGIFYLLNAALALELYGDFTMPHPEGIALSPWDLLALAGHAWFGAPFRRDPVWAALAGLAGRPARERPGRRFAPPRAWRVPAPWLAAWGETGTLHVHATRARLRVLHPVGFLVCDVAREPGRTPLAQARALCGGIPPLRHATLRRVRTLPPGPRVRTPAARWLQALLGFLRTRLALALGADDPAAVPAVVCRHAAGVLLTRTAMDVHLSLDGLPVEVRIAGLDRDTGWIPAAGRSVRFHFA
jgi:hypothetical protein